MASLYPNAIDALPTSHVDNVSEVVHAIDVNNLADAVNKIEAELGITPKGTYATVAARLAAIGSGGGSLSVINLAAAPYSVVAGSPGAATANRTAIQAAFAAAAANGSAVYLPPATQPYFVDIALVYPSEPIEFFGAGEDVSVLATTNGTILTYSNTTAPLSGASDPWSRNSTLLGGSGAAVHYFSKAWRIHDIGFTKSDSWTGNSGTGIDFPNWSGVSDGLVMYMWNVKITNFNGPGMKFLINGTRQESVFFNVLVDGCANEGIIHGSDQWWIGSHSNNNGYEGWWADSRSTMVATCKAYSNGTLLHTSRNAGFYFKGESSGASMYVHCYGQDNNGPALVLDTAKKVIVTNFVADRNCWNGGTLDTTKQAGMLIIDSSDIQVSDYFATDSYAGAKTNGQLHALKITNPNSTNARIRISLDQAQTTGASNTVTDPVDPASDLNGADVKVGGNGGGQIALTFAAAGMTPDPYKAQTQVVGTLTANMTGSIAVPTYAHKGARMRFKFTQDGTGGRTLSWAAGYKQAVVTTGNTANKITIVEFEYDGTNWIQVNSNLWV